MPAAAPPSLATRMAPPLLLPGEHFATALVFLLAGAVGVIWAAPDIARGSFAMPRVAATTHLFTLGWITTTILGALYQFLPVALQTPIRSQRVAHAGLLLYAPGLVLFVAGLMLTRLPLMLVGAALFGTALLLFVGNLAATLHAAKERNLSWWALTGAAFALASTVVLGVSLAGNLRWGYLGPERFLAVGVHLHVAIFGWVLLTVVGVAHRLLPMFLLSHGATERPGRIAAGLLASGVAVLLVTHHALAPWLLWTIAALLGGGVVALLTQAALFFRRRRKPVLDPGMRLAAAGLVLLGFALVLGPFYLGMGLTAPRFATAYVAALLGALILFVAGHYYKILPFLIWFHRFGPLVGKRVVPRVAELYARKPAEVAFGALAVGMYSIVLATLLGAAVGVRTGGVLLLAGAIILAAQMISIARRRPT